MANQSKLRNGSRGSAGGLCRKGWLVKFNKWFWLVWVLLFFVLEAWAWQTGGRTMLSEIVYDARQQHPWTGSLLVAALAWLAWHWLVEPKRPDRS